MCVIDKKCCFFRAGSLGCGYPGSGLVCCPRSCSYTNGWFQPSYPSATASGIGGKQDNEHKCGVTIVQGENYRGIGAQPWVVRVGFRSTFFKIKKYFSILYYFFRYAFEWN